MKKALVADDTKNIRNLLSTCLEIEHYEITMAQNGQEAYEYLKNENFDLAFIDIKMPLMTGTEVLRRVKSEGIKTPIIIMTAFPTVKNAVECTKMGAIIYLQKPFTMERIKNVLTEVNDLEQNEVSVLLEKTKIILSEGDVYEAYELLKQALYKSPENWEIYMLLSEVFIKMDNPELADKFTEIYKILKR